MRKKKSFTLKRNILLLRLAAILLPMSFAFAAVSQTAFAKTYVITDGDRVVTYTTFATHPQEVLDEMNSIMDTLKGALILIAGISLLVGGIGIMNIMLVSVTERTREIGIRKSLGARKKHIMQQFVIEAATVSGIGGILGILLGGVVAYIIGMVMSITVIPSVSAVVVAFSVSVGIGIIFGFLPAKNAATLNPIDALRFE